MILSLDLSVVIAPVDFLPARKLGNSIHRSMHCIRYAVTVYTAYRDFRDAHLLQRQTRSHKMLARRDASTMHMPR